MMHANKREEVDSVSAGDIAAAVGLKDTTTGDTLCDMNNQIILEKMNSLNLLFLLLLNQKLKLLKKREHRFIKTCWKKILL